MKKRILFLMSDTGGGHRAAAEAIRDALFIRHGPDRVEAKLVDVFKDYCFPPFSSAPETYPLWVNYSKTTWGLTFEIPNTPRRAKIAAQVIYRLNRYKLNQVPIDHPADVVVSVHSVITRPSLRAYLHQRHRPPFVTVVTDLASTPMLWYEDKVERCFVPTRRAYERGLQCGLQDKQLKITGLPVHPGFIEALTGKSEARTELGWDQELPAVLMVAGGEGMGPIYETARAINQNKTKCQLIIIAGKNESLKKKLESRQWHQPTKIYPFVTNMPQMMAAADILVTKAGPATICEACIAGLPMILSDAIPGQEPGNVEFVVNNNAGVYAPSPKLVAGTVQDWLTQGQEKNRPTI